MRNKVEFIPGGIHVDDRGQIIFCNGFDMKTVRRFYMVSNHEPKFIRAWHGHKKETKFVFVARGTALVSAVKIDNWEKPDKDAVVHQHVLSEKRPGILVMPAGHANGVMTLAAKTQVIFFSDRTLEESKGDDYRYDSHYWNPWKTVSH